MFKIQIAVISTDTTAIKTRPTTTTVATDNAAKLTIRIIEGHLNICGINYRKVADPEF